jgi:hypothetical protein
MKISRPQKAGQPIKLAQMLHFFLPQSVMHLTALQGFFVGLPGLISFDSAHTSADLFPLNNYSIFALTSASKFSI